MGILKFKQFLLQEREALRDELPPHHIKALKDIYGKKADKYLNMDTLPKAENIKEGKWKLTPKEKDYIINLIFNDISVDGALYEITSFVEDINDMDENFMKVFNMAKVDKKLNFYNIPKNAIELTLYIEKFYSNNFYSINVKETKASEKILRDKKGVPILKDGKIQKVKKEKDEVIFNMNNKSSFSTFFNAYCDIFGGDVYDPFYVSDVRDFYSRTKEILDLDLIENFDMELYITSKPSDILNMAISKFYDSCQNLYNGEYRNRILSNVFDSNMKVAYLIFNTPFTDRNGNVNPITSIVRCIIRNIKGELYFDRIYPDLDNNDKKLKVAFHDIITKYSGMKAVSQRKSDNITYYYTAPDEDLIEPYQDNLMAVRVVVDDKLKVLSSFLKTSYDDIEKEYTDANLYSFNGKAFYIVDKDKDDFIKYCSTNNIKRKIPYSNTERKQLVNVLNYFNFKKFGKLDGIKGNEDVIKSKVKEIIDEYYLGNVLDFIKENEDCLDIKKIIIDKYPYFIITSTTDGKCHSVDKYNIYNIW